MLSSSSNSSSCSNPTQGHQHHHLAPSKVYPNLTCLAAASSLSLPVRLFACAEQGLPLSRSVPRHPFQPRVFFSRLLHWPAFVCACFTSLLSGESEPPRSRPPTAPRVLCFLELPSTWWPLSNTHGAVCRGRMLLLGGMLTADFRKQCTTERLERLLSNGFFEIPLDFDSNHDHSVLAFPGSLPGPTSSVLPPRSAIPFSPFPSCSTR